MVIQTNFNDLITHLRELIKSASYSESTVRDMDFIFRSFADYMDANDMEKYSPQIGEDLIQYCSETLQICDSRIARARIIVSKLNRLYQGLDGDEVLWAKKPLPTDLPTELIKALNSFISYCKDKGNKETTQNKKWRICFRFLKQLELLGYHHLSELSGETIQKAFFQLNYTAYWTEIGQFVGYLYEAGILRRNYSTLIVNHRKFSPQPTVYTQKEILDIEGSVDTTTANGVRNYAIILLLSRYGIRSRDISALTFDDLDFENNRIHFVQQKTGDLWEMELFPEVKKALQNYITSVRPTNSPYSNIFLANSIPHKPLSCDALNTALEAIIAQSSSFRVGKRHGSRAFRSSITSNMINDNVPTAVVRKVLGHGTKHAIRYYSKIDIESMRLCPLYAPQPSGVFSKALMWKENVSNV